MKGTFTVEGQRVRTSSNRRFVLFQVYTNLDGGQSVAIWKRTDSLNVARKVVGNFGWASNRHLVIVDTTTGETIT